MINPNNEQRQRIKEMINELSIIIINSISDELKVIYSESNLPFQIDYPYGIAGGTLNSIQSYSEIITLQVEDPCGNKIPEKLYNIYETCLTKYLTNK